MKMNFLKMMPLRRKLAVVIGLTALAGLGVTAYAAITNVIAVGNIPHSETLGGAGTVTVRTISFAPGEVGAWHYHPGPLFNVLTQGTVTVEDGCGGEQSYTVGQAFEEGGRVHRPKNLGGEPTFAYQTFVIPAGNPTTVNIPNNERKCGPARTLAECSHGGWRNFNFPEPFDNAWDCYAYVFRNR
jgi:quercetin dioxygenase-like cupin family protein